jgi:RNA polymerase sigma factor (TIGR02999 family)
MDSRSITALLEAWKGGDRSAENALAAHIYPVLRDLARSQVRRNAGLLTLRATELANEAYERLHRQQHVDWQNRHHFFAIAATVIRRVVVDYLRHRGAEKRGSESWFIPIEDAADRDLAVPDRMVDWIALDQALSKLHDEDRDSARVAELRLFSALSLEEIAEITNSSIATVGRHWRFARVWLAAQIAGAGAAG